LTSKFKQIFVQQTTIIYIDFRTERLALYSLKGYAGAICKQASGVITQLYSPLKAAIIFGMQANDVVSRRLSIHWTSRRSRRRRRLSSVHSKTNERMSRHDLMIFTRRR